LFLLIDFHHDICQNFNPSKLDFAIKNDKSHVSKISQNTFSLLGVTNIVLLFSRGLVFPITDDSFPIKMVEDYIAPTGKVYVSVDFNHHGICDTESVLISILTAEKIGINSQCFLPSI
jgi:hypothetical protein